MRRLPGAALRVCAFHNGTDRHTPVEIVGVADVKREVHVGELVYWRDPDNDLSSGNYRVAQVFAEPGQPLDLDTIILLTHDAGGEAEVPLGELEDPMHMQITFAVGSSTVATDDDVARALRDIAKRFSGSRLNAAVRGEGVVRDRDGDEICTWIMGPKAAQ